MENYQKYLNPQTLASLEGLDLQARLVVEGYVAGMHPSPYHGFSVEFSEYREYSPGDDPRYLDWRLYARSDRYYVKRFEDETNLRCYLVLDTSRSMSYRSGSYTKHDYARTAAATICAYWSFDTFWPEAYAIDSLVSSSRYIRRFVSSSYCLR